MIKNSPHCIDFFLESTILNTQRGKKFQKGGYINNHKSVLNQMRRKFKNCSKHNLSKDKDAAHSAVEPCEFNNLRLHNFDLRQNIKEGTDTISECQNMSN